MTGKPPSAYGYQDKQVRDNIHTLERVNAFYHFYHNPSIAEVYNMGGSRFSNCSMSEAIKYCESITEKRLNWSYAPANREGDHTWWISDAWKFKEHYPKFNLTYTVNDISGEVHTKNNKSLELESIARIHNICIDPKCRGFSPPSK